MSVPSNHSLHRAPRRNVLGGATTSECLAPEARLCDPVEGGAGALKNVRLLANVVGHAN